MPIDITTKDIIKVLPFEEKFRAQLLESFDHLTPDQKFNMDRVLWDAYDELFDIRLDKNVRLALERARNNQEKIDSGLYLRAKIQTEKEMEAEFHQQTTQVDLTSVRGKLEQLMQKKPE